MMLTLPPEIMRLMEVFRPVFSERVWDWVQVLLVGAILAPGRRTVTRILRVMGLGQERQFQNYHRVLNRAVWSSRALSQQLLWRLVAAFVPPGATVVLGADETLERRRGAHIAGLGCFRDAARSTAKNKVKSMGLRWLSMMLLVSVPWSRRVWALPFLTLLAPGGATDAQNGLRHKTSPQHLQRMVSQVRRWLPGRRIVLVVDGALAAIQLGLRCRRFREPVTYVTRLRMDARLFDLPPERKPGTRGRKRVAGRRQPKAADRLTNPTTGWQTARVSWYDGQPRQVQYVSEVALWYNTSKPPLLGRWVLLSDPSGQLKPCLLFATDPEATPEQIIQWFVMRWSVEVTFEEVRAHLGFETQRQWNALAIARSSPALLGLFSFVTLLADQLSAPSALACRSTAWYSKTETTFADCLAFVRTTLWTQTHFPTSRPTAENVKIPLQLLQPWLELLSYAA
jgi:hypothetical protein